MTHHVGIKCEIPNDVEGEICSESLQRELISAFREIAQTIDEYGCLVHNSWQKAQKVLWSEPRVEPLAECLPFFTLIIIGKALSQYTCYDSRAMWKC